MMLTSGLTCRCCLQVAHLAQHFKASAASGPGVPIGQRSFLGGLLPESLLHVLTSYGAGAFAAALCGDADTPELVWTHRMRAQRLVPQVCACKRNGYIGHDWLQSIPCSRIAASCFCFGIALDDVCDIAQTLTVREKPCRHAEDLPWTFSRSSMLCHAEHQSMLLRQ